jgi:hypothetical protein
VVCQSTSDYPFYALCLEVVTYYVDSIDSYSRTVNTWMAQVSERWAKILKILRTQVMRQICEAKGNTARPTAAISNPFNDTLDDLDESDSDSNKDDNEDFVVSSSSLQRRDSDRPLGMKTTRSQRHINGVCYTTDILLLRSANAIVPDGPVYRQLIAYVCYHRRQWLIFYLPGRE